MVERLAAKLIWPFFFGLLSLRLIWLEPNAMKPRNWVSSVPCHCTNFDLNSILRALRSPPRGLFGAFWAHLRNRRGERAATIKIHPIFFSLTHSDTLLPAAVKVSDGMPIKIEHKTDLLRSFRERIFSPSPILGVFFAPFSPHNSYDINRTRGLLGHFGGKWDAIFSWFGSKVD